MDKINEWINLQSLSDTGLHTWGKIDTLDDEQYLKIQYRNDNGEVVGKTQDYPVKLIKSLNNMIDIYRAKTRHSHVDMNNFSR